jgi:hypothetical protein
MPTLEIHDTLEDRSFLAVDLRHIITALKHRAAEADWEIGAVTSHAEGLWAVGDEDAVQKLETMAALGGRVPGQTFAAVANNIHQVVWGEFRAFDHAALSPWVVIRAIDSTFYEVYSEDLGVIESIRSTFTDVRIQNRVSEP